MTVEKEVAARATTALGEGDFEGYRQLVKSVPHEDGAPIWTHIASAHPARINLFDVLLSSAGDAERTRRTFRYVLPAVGRLTLASEADFLKVLEFAGRMGNSFQLSIAQKVAPLMGASPGLGARLGSLLLRKNHSSQALDVWQLSFAWSAPLEAAKYVLSLLPRLPDSANQLARLVIALSGRSEEAIVLLMTKEVELVEALVDNEQALGRLAWAALDSMSSYSEIATNALLAGVAASSRQAISVVCISLYGASSLTYGAAAVPVADVLSSLVGIAIGDIAIRHDVDEALAVSLMRPELQPLVMTELQRFAKHDIDMYESFKSTVQTLHGAPNLLAQLVTAWLFDDDFRVEPLRSLLSPIGSMGSNVFLDASKLVGASDEGRLKAIHRLILAVHSGELLLSYIKDLVETEAMQPKGIGLGTSLLEFVWKEYPGTTQRFVDARLKELKPDGAAAHLYRQIEEAGRNWDARLAALPPRKELSPTTAESMALRAVRMKRSRQISRFADEGSIFASIFSKSSVAQGNSFVVEMANGTEAITQMHGMSVSMELRFSATSDPVGAFLARLETLRGAY